MLDVFANINTRTRRAKDAVRGTPIVFIDRAEYPVTDVERAKYREYGTVMVDQLIKRKNHEDFGQLLFVCALGTMTMLTTSPSYADEIRKNALPSCAYIQPFAPDGSQIAPCLGTMN